MVLLLSPFWCNGPIRPSSFLLLFIALPLPSPILSDDRLLTLLYPDGQVQGSGTEKVGRWQKPCAPPMTPLSFAVARGHEDVAKILTENPVKEHQKQAGRQFSQPCTFFLADLCTTKVFVTFKILTFPLLEDRPNAPLAYHFHLAGRVRSS